MKLSRIDQIALNGGDGLHYKYEEIAEKIIKTIVPFADSFLTHYKKRVVKILVEAFPDA